MGESNVPEELIHRVNLNEMASSFFERQIHEYYIKSPFLKALKQENPEEINGFKVALFAYAPVRKTHGVGESVEHLSKEKAETLFEKIKEELSKSGFQYEVSGDGLVRVLYKPANFEEDLEKPFYIDDIEFTKNKTTALEQELG